MLAMIWEQSIKVQGDSITDHYIKLFHEHKECADIASVIEKVSPSTAKTIWNRLRTTSSDAFFYSEQDNSQSYTTDQVNGSLFRS
jgi:hypothetical protein